MKPKLPWQEMLRTTPRKIKEYWRNRFSSTNKRMTRGSWNISKIISRARSENWRRKEPKK